jgi:excisionase family DNA binding protein
VPDATIVDTADAILTPEEVATMLKVPERWCYERTRARRGAGPAMPFFRVGRYIRFSRAAVLAWLHDTETTAPSRPRRYRKSKKEKK